MLTRTDFGLFPPLSVSSERKGLQRTYICNIKLQKLTTLQHRRHIRVFRHASITKLISQNHIETLSEERKHRDQDRYYSH